MVGTSIQISHGYTLLIYEWPNKFRSVLEKLGNVLWAKQVK